MAYGMHASACACTHSAWSASSFVPACVSHHVTPPDCLLAPRPQYLVSGSGDSSVKVWDLERQYVVRDITSAHTADVLCVSTSKMANHVFLTAGSEGTVIFHDHRVRARVWSL